MLLGAVLERVRAQVDRFRYFPDVDAPQISADSFLRNKYTL